MKRVIEKTDDGSATLFVPELNEHYHSTKGARTESQHIFINAGRLCRTPRNHSHRGQHPQGHEKAFFIILHFRPISVLLSAYFF